MSAFKWPAIPLAALLLGFGSSCLKDEAGEMTPGTLSCFDPSIHRLPAFSLEKHSNVSLEASSMADAVTRLNVDFDLPISFIEGQGSGFPMSLNAESITLREILRHIIERSPEYRCAVVDGRRMVIFGRVDGLHSLIPSVEISEMYRIPAARKYLEELAHVHDQRELPTGVLAGMSGDGGELLGEKVSLSGSGTVLENLVQLLGNAEGVYFFVLRSTSGGRYLTFGEVSAPPGEDVRRAQR